MNAFVLSHQHVANRAIKHNNNIAFTAVKTDRYATIKRDKMMRYRTDTWPSLKHKRGKNTSNQNMPRNHGYSIHISLGFYGASDNRDRSRAETDKKVEGGWAKKIIDEEADVASIRVLWVQTNTWQQW
jgi:hypothetical protein